MSKELLTALDVLEKEKGVKREVVIEALENALVSAYKRNYGQAQNVEVEFDEKIKTLKLSLMKRRATFTYMQLRMLLMKSLTPGWKLA